MRLKITVFLFLLATIDSFAQRTITLTLEETIRLSQEQSLDAMVGRNTFLSNYWSYRSFKAELLPSLNISSDLASFNKSQIALQDAQTGKIYYRNNYNLRNNASLYIQQNIAATGGTLSVGSSLNRLDQYRPNRDITYLSQPVTLTYLQPVFGYNRLKWSKKLEPKKYERSKKEFLETMENITIKAVRSFYNVAIAKIDYDLAVSNYENNKLLYSIALRRFNETGSVNRRQLVQLELGLVNDSIAINTQENNYQAVMMTFRSFLGYNNTARIEVAIPEVIPDVKVDYDFVIQKALENGSFSIGQVIRRIESESSVAQARSGRGITVSVNGNYGLSSNGENKFADAYTNLLNSQVFGISLSIPIMDWGMGKGRVKIAQAQQRATLYNIEQDIIDYEQGIYLDVIEFNAQHTKYMMSKRALELALENYTLATADFTDGKISVTELYDAQKEKDSANKSYINEMRNFWERYFNLRKTTLYDFMSGTDISAEYEKIIKE